MIETELPEDAAGGMPDSILSLYSTDGNTKIAENEDDPRSSGSRKAPHTSAHRTPACLARLRRIFSFLCVPSRRLLSGSDAAGSVCVCLAALLPAQLPVHPGPQDTHVRKNPRRRRLEPPWASPGLGPLSPAAAWSSALCSL